MHQKWKGNFANQDQISEIAKFANQSVTEQLPNSNTYAENKNQIVDY